MTAMTAKIPVTLDRRREVLHFGGNVDYDVPFSHEATHPAIDRALRFLSNARDDREEEIAMSYVVKVIERVKEGRL